MSMEYIRSTYGVPAKRGGRVEYTGYKAKALGTITGSSGPHICIRLDGDKRSVKFHPTWKLRYLEDAK